MPQALTALRLKDLDGYPALRERVRRTLLLGQARIERENVHTYWKTGRHIHSYILRHKERAEYGRQVLRKLADDLEVGDELLYRSLRFYQTFPISSARRKLTWTHYRTPSCPCDPLSEK